VASVVGDVIGTKGDAFCDRRYVTDPRWRPRRFARSWSTRSPRRSSRTTVALDSPHRRRRALPSRKDRGRVQDIGDQRRWLRSLHWYYDVSDLEAKSGREFQSHVSSADAVRAKCADPERYSDGANSSCLDFVSRKKRKLTALMATCATTGPARLPVSAKTDPRSRP